jgi:hypothetical protein
MVPVALVDRGAELAFFYSSANAVGRVIAVANIIHEDAITVVAFFELAPIARDACWCRKTRLACAGTRMKPLLAIRFLTQETKVVDP